MWLSSRVGASLAFIPNTTDTQKVTVTVTATFPSLAVSTAVSLTLKGEEDRSPTFIGRSAKESVVISGNFHGTST